LPPFVFIKKEQLYGFPRCLALGNPPDFCENPEGEYAENMRNLEKIRRKSSKLGT
jgi:hypothetical protein